MKAAKNNPVLTRFYKKLFAFRAARFSHLFAAGKAARRAEYIQIMREYFLKLHDERMFEESWMLLKLIAKNDYDYQCIRIRHSKSIVAGIPTLGANALWAGMMLSVVDFAQLKAFSDLAFGRDVSRPAVMLSQNII